MKLDKKQLPQYLALGVLTAGVGGYTVIHFAAPGPVSANTRPVAAPVTAAMPSGLKPAGAASAGTASPADTGDAPPPSPTMHDPFVVGYVDPGTLPVPPGAVSKLPALGQPAPGKQIASLAPLSPLSPLPVGLPSAPPLPGSGLGTFSAKAPGLPAGPAVPTLPAAPVPLDPPKWTVTGVLMGADGKVAILRSGDARRIVRAGDFVDSVYRVTAVSRTAVQLRHGASVYRIVLGGDKPTPGTSSPGTSSSGTSSPGTFSPMLSVPAAAPPKVQLPAVMGSAIIPVYHSAKPHLPLAHLTRQGAGLTLTAASVLSVPRTARRQPAAAKVARAISLGLRLLDGSVLAPRKE